MLDVRVMEHNFSKKEIDEKHILEG